MYFQDSVISERKKLVQRSLPWCRNIRG